MLAPRGRSTGRGGGGCGGRARSWARYAPRRDPLHPSLFASSFDPSLRSPPQAPVRCAREGRIGCGVLELWRAAVAALGDALPRRVPHPTAASGARPGLRLAGGQAGSPLPRAPSRARWPRPLGQPQPILGRLPSVSPRATQSTPSLLRLPVSSPAHPSSSPPLLALLQCPAALRSAPPAFPGPPPSPGLRQPPPGSCACYCWDHSPRWSAEAAASSGPWLPGLLPSRSPCWGPACSLLLSAPNQAPGRGGKPGSWVILTGSWV